MKKIFIAILLLLAVLLAICGLIYIFLIPIEKLFIPTDQQRINELFNQKFPGYSNIKILKASGSGAGPDDPRLIAVRVSLENGEEPVICEGEGFFFRGDPGNEGFIWQSLECEGINNLIWCARSAITTSYDPHLVWYPPYFSSFKPEIASVLYYWIKHGKITIDQIKWPEIKTLTEEMVSGKIVVKKQIVLFDSGKKEIIDLAPQEAAGQKVRQYFLRCDGILREYQAKANTDIIGYLNANPNEDFQLHNPLADLEDKWKVK